MKFGLALLVTICLISCNEPTQQSILQQPVEENWQIARIVTQKNFYNQANLLDTTYRVEDMYVDGVSRVLMNFIVVREYVDNKNLRSERTFQIFERGKKELISEVLYKYDNKNKLVVVTDKFQNVISKITMNKYDKKNQKIEEVNILKHFEEIPAAWNGDSILAHHNDKKLIKYDTSLISYQYDNHGNQVKKIYHNSNGEVSETLTSLFSDNKKTITFSVGPKGDTVAITNYKTKANLITETDHLKYDSLSTHIKLYAGDLLIQTIFIDKRANFKAKETYRYDIKGNEVENISYK